ncbi:Coenzyme A disulfide reductase [Limihaloglobus sulfuriphilus]|uniref:Coenzyme A disulfide reductase n=1 Tax=Limihaloglobus sulfuriphilus TaxID=1851148 RepID=A0A1Q2MFM0_9BACT|nr:FAD-dependent oxidoreductase [Limihaloglobus sulfuriphilus]AQQ71459.1 Coenzyme A disulfide reductase [Limihaloglobus sulfuriphilus]
MSENLKIVIVGGVAGGASTAARCRRLSETAEIHLFERNSYISFANCGMPYYISGVISDRKEMNVQSIAGMEKRYRVNVRCGCEVTSIDRENKTITYTEIESGTQAHQQYDKLVLSPGAEIFRPPLPGGDNPRVMSLRNLEDMDRIKLAAEKYADKPAIVIGGGYIGLEMAESLRERGMEVMLVELADQVFVAADREMAAPLHKELRKHGIDLRLRTSLTSVKENGDELEVTLNDGSKARCGMVIMAVGVRPEVKLAKEAGIEIGGLGGIAVNENMQTSDPDIYAVGDAVEVTNFVTKTKALIPLAGPANRQGRIAADNIFGRKSTYKGTQGTSVCKIFDQTIAMTGANEKQLKKLGIPYEKIYVHPLNHAGYYPGATPVHLKLLFDSCDGRVLGAQAVGLKGIEKRIDVIAVAIRAGMTAEDLSELELSYAPPYGSAKDPVNFAGFVANNVVIGDMDVCHTDEILELDEERQILLDVRTPKEIEAGTLPGATAIPVDQLRDRIDELDKGKDVLVSCRMGLRGYIATKILNQNGFKARNYTGGYLTYQQATADK